MTFLGLHDEDNVMNDYGHLDIVDFIIRHCTDVESNLRELYHRVAFNICIGNSDDLFRNHGFSLTPKGRTLSPTYDRNPTLNKHQRLLITNTSNEADLKLLGDASEEYMLSREVATNIISEVGAALRDWPPVVTQLGISQEGKVIFADRWRL